MDISLVDIAKESALVWETMRDKLAKMTSRSGTGSEYFEQSCRKLLTAVVERKERLAYSIDTRIDVRACTYLWLESPLFLEASNVSKETLNRFRQLKEKLGFVSFYHLIQLYFKKYDQCGDIQSLIDFINAEFEQYQSASLFGDMLKLKENRKWIFDTRGYERVSRIAETKHQELDVVMGDLGIDAFATGRFVEMTSGYYFIRKIGALKPEDDQSFLQEVSKPNISEIAYHDQLLGHFIIEGLAENVRANNIEMPENWLQAILSIAGDPRIPKASAQYQKWWAHISSRTIELIHERISGFDLKLFLEVLDDFAARSGDASLRRMFPKRRIFLQGLYEQKLIRGARLFISREAHAYLERNYEDGELPNYARVTDRNTSIIYLKLDGVHIVEGSHNHRFWIYDQMPDGAPPNNYDKEVYARSELSNITSSARARRLRVRPRGDFPWYVNHNGNWQARVIGQLRAMNIRVDPELVLDREDYRSYRSTYGIRR